MNSLFVNRDCCQKMKYIADLICIMIIVNTYDSANIFSINLMLLADLNYWEKAWKNEISFYRSVSVLKYTKKTGDFCLLIFRFKTDRGQTCDTDIQQINHGFCFTGDNTTVTMLKQQNPTWFLHSILQREKIIVPNIKCKQKTD